MVLRLSVAFGALILLLASVCWVGMDRMASLNSGIQEIVDRQWRSVQLAQEALLCSAKANRLTMQIFLAEDRSTIDDLLAQREAATQRIVELLNRLKATCTSPQQHALLAEVEARRVPYVQGYERALQLLLERADPVAGRRMMLEQVVPSLIAYHEAWEAFVREQNSLVDAEASRADAEYHATTRSGLSLLVAAAALAGAIGIFVTRSLTREIASREKAEVALVSAQRELMSRQIGTLEKIVTARTAELRVSEALFQVIAENVPDLITVLDSARRRIYDSPSYQRALGIAPGELFRAPAIARVHPDDQQTVELSIRKAAHSGESLTFEYRARHRDGTWRTLEGHAMPVKHENGRGTHIVLVARDITERKQQAELDLRREVQFRHLQKMESIGQLAAGIAHEINTPTQYIGDNTHFVRDSFDDITRVLAAYARLLTAAKEGAVAPELLDEIEVTVEECDVEYLVEEVPKAIRQSLEGVERVAKIVGAMKEFSHPGTDRKISADLNRVVNSAIIVATNEWKYVANVETRLDPGVPPIPCLPSEISQVIVNMVVNAAHAIADVVGSKGDKGTITVSTRADGDWAEIRVADTGAGIPPEIQGKIFDPFFTTKGVGRGTGQGLAIAHSVIVDKHGGIIEVESAVGRGTTFIIRLPSRIFATEEVEA
jgi:PAS domain S-box-containing protein